MGSSHSSKKKVSSLLEDLLDGTPRGRKRTEFIEKIWKLVDPKKSGVLDGPRALMLIKALAKHCKARAIKSNTIPKLSKQVCARQLMGFSFEGEDFADDTKEQVQEEFPEFLSLVDGAYDDYVSVFLNKLDMDRDGKVTDKEFRIWISRALDSPVQAMREIFLTTQNLADREPPSMNSKLSKLLVESSLGTTRAGWPRGRKSTERDTKTHISASPTDLKSSLPDLHSVPLYSSQNAEEVDLKPITVITPYGYGHVKIREEKGSLAVHLYWGGEAKANNIVIGYFRTKMVVDDQTGCKHPIIPGVEMAPHNSFKGMPGERTLPDDLAEELSLHRGLAMETVHDDVIRKLTEGQITHYLPVLLKDPYAALLERIETSQELLRRSFWVINSNPGTVHSSYISYVTRNSTDMQKGNTVRFFRDHLQNVEEGMRFENLEILCPLFPAHKVVQVKILSRFTSGHGPLLLSIVFEGLPTLPVKIIYKRDECRADAACMLMFKLFNSCWESADMKLTPYAFYFEVCPLDGDSGIIEYIPNAVELQVWDCSIIASLNDEDLLEFVRSAAGSYVACYILGCRDRHKSNFMIKDSRTFLQIDFKHCFDRQTRGVDAPHFSVQKGMKKALKERQMWQPFKKLCQLAFRTLRRQSQFIIRICLQAFRGLWFTESEMELWLIKAFRLHETEDVAVAQIPRLINEGVSSIQRKLKSWTHKHSLARHQKKKSKNMSVELTDYAQEGGGTEGKKMHRKGRSLQVTSERLKVKFYRRRRARSTGKSSEGGATSSSSSIPLYDITDASDTSVDVPQSTMETPPTLGRHKAAGSTLSFSPKMHRRTLSNRVGSTRANSAARSSQMSRNDNIRIMKSTRAEEAKKTLGQSSQPQASRASDASNNSSYDRATSTESVSEGKPWSAEAKEAISTSRQHQLSGSDKALKLLGLDKRS